MKAQAGTGTVPETPGRGLRRSTSASPQISASSIVHDICPQGMTNQPRDMWDIRCRQHKAGLGQGWPDQLTLSTYAQDSDSYACHPSAPCKSHCNSTRTALVALFENTLKINVIRYNYYYNLVAPQEFKLRRHVDAILLVIMADALTF
jgi:hypothetical protein